MTDEPGTPTEPTLQTTADAAEPDPCDGPDCSEDVGPVNRIEHQAFDAVFCSVACKNRWTNGMNRGLDR